MMKASAMTTKMLVASIIAIIKQCRYNDHTGYKVIVLKFSAKGKQLWKKIVWVSNLRNGGSA